MWEYATRYVPHTWMSGGIKPGKNYERLMREMGEQGWELVSATPHTRLGTHQGDTLYFKRQVKAAS